SSSQSGRSRQLQLQEYALRKPGRLASRLLIKMQDLISREGGPPATDLRSNATPACGVNYFHTILVPTYRDKMHLRLSRELRTLLMALDAVAKGESPRAADLLAQRVKALELYLCDQTWHRAQHLELIPGEGPGLVDKDELWMASREMGGEMKLKQYQANWGQQLGGKDFGKKRGIQGKSRAEREEGVKAWEKGGCASSRLELGEDSPPAGEKPDKQPLPESDLDLGGSDDDGWPQDELWQQLDSMCGKALPLGEWQEMVAKVLSCQLEYSHLGKRLLSLVRCLKSPLQNFAEKYCNPNSLPPGHLPHHDNRGDILPLHPALISQDLEGIDESNLEWVQLIFVILNFHYCAGWTKPVCVPFQPNLSANQKWSIAHIARQVSRTMEPSSRTPSAEEAQSQLASRCFDYSGQPMEFMEDLVAEKVVMAWPKPGKAAVVKLVDCLPHWLREAIESPDDFWVPWDAMPDHSRKSKVRADDHQWWLICRAAHERGLMSYVDDDEELPKDRGGHYICGGAGGVKKIKNINGKEVAAQRFISIFCPQNEVMQLLPGAQDTLPYIGQLAGVLAEKDEYLVLDSEDLESAFNLFEMPRAWWPIFNYGKKVALTAFGGKDKRMVRPVLKVVPMGWSSAVTLVQAAVRHLVFERAAIDPRGDITRLNPLPASKQYSLIYLDNFDQITKLTAAEMQVARGEPSPDHAKFIKACDELGLPRNLGKQVLASFVGPLYSIMQEVFHSIEAAKGKQGGIRPSEVVMDEVFSLMSLSICAELNLRAPISSEISCTDASPTGGGSAIASKFKEKSLLMNAPVSPAATVCSQCSGGWPADLGARRYEAFVSMKESQKRHIVFSLAHPCDSYVWHLEECLSLDKDVWLWACFCLCCFGGSSAQWLWWPTNSPHVFKALHKPVCAGHHGLLLPAEWHDTGGNDSAFDYPWALCVAYANGLKQAFRDNHPFPEEIAPPSLKGLLTSQLQGATRGFQSPAAVKLAVDIIDELVRTMDADSEMDHLWAQPQHINILEVSAFLVELRRRARQHSQLGKRFFNVIDCAY
ncbi:unnamed protein product, partial [Effrenium voratum]